MEVTRIFDVLEQSRDKFQRKDALVSKTGGEWKYVSTDEYYRKSYQLAYALLDLGLKKGDKVASVSNNRYEWNILDMAISMAGMIHVPIYPTISLRSYLYVLNHSEANALFVAGEDLYRKVSPILVDIESLKHVYTFEPVDEAKHWEELLSLGEVTREKHAEKLEEIKDSIQPDDMTTIIYTSGTTGTPKGVMLSHDNFISNVKASAARLRLNEKHICLSFLPINHVYERMVNYQYQYKGIGIYYAENMATIGDDLRYFKPHGFATVPRVLEKVYDKIITKGKTLSLIKRMMLHWAVKLGVKYEADNGNSVWYKLKLKIANKLVFKKWREALGGNILFVCSGGAALQERLERIFWAAGIRIQEGYGLTETSPIISANLDYYPEVKFGTVGTLLDRIEVKIARDGEILTKGPNLMLGYYKDEELTRQVIDEDGWFHTGDIGEMVEGKFLKITDRKKEIFKTSGGVYVAPQVIENRLKESIFIDQVMVIGEKKRFPAAIISPNFEFLRQYCNKKKIDFTSDEDIINDGFINCRLGIEIEKVNASLDHHKQIKQFRMVKEPWTPESGELSPTLKLKRHILKQRYKTVYEEIYLKELDEFL